MSIQKCLLLLTLCASIASAETSSTEPPLASTAPDLALWEIGMVSGGSYLPDYPAADQSRPKWIVAPYGVYRGKVMRADREGARARLVKTRTYDVDIGIAASFASRSKDNDARRGMPDLDYLLELGPRFCATLWQFGNQGKLRLFLPLRAVFATDLGYFHHQGFTAAPALHARWPLAWKGWLAISQLTANFANRQMSAYFYDVAPAYVRPDRPFYDAKGGYIGTDLFGGFLIPINSRLRMFTGAQLLVHSGAANQDSPLFKRDVNYSVAAGLVWTFYRSQRQALLID